MVNVAIIGSGKMGILHGAILGALPDARVVAICERKWIIRRFGKNAFPGVRVVEHLSDLAGLGVDAVYVTTLPGSHCEVVREVFEREIAANVFVEKSLAASYEEAREMNALAEAQGAATMVGFQKRFSKTFDKAKRLLDEGAIGEIAGFDAWSYSSDFAEASADARQSASRGGVLRDAGSHAIDLALWYFGDLEVLAPAEGTPLTDLPADFSSARVGTSSGIVGTFSVSAQMADYRLPEIGITIKGSEGRIDVNDDQLELVNDRQTQRWHRQDLADSEVEFLLGEAEYSRENDAFIAAVATGLDHGGADFEAGARVERIIDAMLGAPA